MGGEGRTSAARRWAGRVAVWAIAIALLAFVVRAVPIHDRCDDPAAVAAAPTSAAAPPQVTVVARDAAGCTIARGGVREHLAPAACDALRCTPGLATVAARAHPIRIAVCWAIYVVGTAAWALRWRALLALAGVRLSARAAWRITLEAQAGGVVLPGGIGGDALRIGAAVGRGAPVVTVVASVFLDRVIGLVTMASIAVAVSLLFATTTAGVTSGGAAAATATPLLVVLAAIPLGFVAAVTVLRVPRLRRVPWLARGAVGRLAAPILDYFGHPGAPRAILRGLALSLVVSGVQLGVIRGILGALDVVPTNETWVYVGATMASIVGALPGLPGGWGTADAAYVAFFASAGVPASAALAVCLVYRLFWYSGGAIGASLFVLRGGGQGRASHLTPAGKP